MKRNMVVLAALVVVIGNLIPLARVLWDRSGPPRSVTEFSVRELGWAYVDDENSGVALRWDWWHSRLDSLTQAELAPFEMRCDSLHEKCWPSRMGFVVVGIDSARWSADSLSQRRHLDSLIRVGSRDTSYLASQVRTRRRESRLTILDASLSREELVAKWGTDRMIIAARLTGEPVTYRFGISTVDPHKDLHNLDVDLEPSELHLPTELRHLYRDLPSFRYTDSVPESFATVTVGRTGLPRITGIRWSEPKAP